MSATATEQSVVQLQWSAADGGRITVTPQDQDRFVLKVNQAIEILQQGHAAKKFERQFNLLLRMLAEWIRDTTRQVRKAYLTERDGALAFVVIRESCAYDDEFEDELSALDFRLANDPDLNLITLNVIALPSISDNATSSFVNPSFVLEYAGNAH